MNRLLPVALGSLLLFGACDASKPELIKTKQQLAEVTSERDKLKTDLEVANSQVTELTGKVKDLEAKAVAAKPIEPEADKAAAKGSKKKGAHTAAKKKKKHRK